MADINIKKEKVFENSCISDEEKKYIAFQIKNIDKKLICEEMEKLIKIGANSTKMSSRCRIGNNLVDYFTFVERLNTKGKYNINYFDFLKNIEIFKEKKFIKNMINYYTIVKNKNNTKNNYIVLKEVYNICISAINIFRPLVAMDIYTKYNPTSVLDFTCGWGGRLIGACALKIPNYIGIDINTNLKPCYENMITFLNENNINQTKFDLYFEDATHFDYSKIKYDMVLTSPPYFFLEKYSNNNEYNSKQEMINKFYNPIISKTFKYLQKGGKYCLNVNKVIYEDICIPLLGNAVDIIPLKKSKRQNDYIENIYVWYKNNDI
jgi:hypothetical protein